MHFKIFSFPLFFFVFGSCADQMQDQTQAGMGLFDGKTIVDLTHDYSDETVYWVTADECDLDTVAYGESEGGYLYAAVDLSAAQRGGSHVDAPVHFVENAIAVDGWRLEGLIGDAVKVDVEDKVANDRDYQIAIQDLADWEEE